MFSYVNKEFTKASKFYWNRVSKITHIKKTLSKIKFLIEIEYMPYYLKARDILEIREYLIIKYDKKVKEVRMKAKRGEAINNI